MAGNYTVDCRLCMGAGLFCPGCTGGKIQEIDDSLFMGCGSEIRCPLCFGFDAAHEDKAMVKKLERDDDEDAYDVWHKAVFMTMWKNPVWREECNRRADAREARSSERAL